MRRNRRHAETEQAVGRSDDVEITRPGVDHRRAVPNSDSQACGAAAAQSRCFRKAGAEPDVDVIDLYEQACGYNPNQGGEGPGGNEQHVLTYILKTGAPFGPKGQQRHKITAFAEVDVKNVDNIERTIYDHGVAYIGFNVPQYIMPSNAPPLAVWDVEPKADNSIVGGHAVVLAGYNASGARVISWGQYYTMTWAFFEKFVDEAYAITDPLWTNTTARFRRNCWINICRSSKKTE